MEAKEPRLIRALAEARVFGNFEFIFGVIFGSQVDTLKQLREGPTTEVELEKQFEDNIRPKDRDLHDTWTYVAWSAFLRNHALILSEDGTISLTQKGLEFIEFVLASKVGVPRPN